MGELLLLETNKITLLLLCMHGRVDRTGCLLLLSTMFLLVLFVVHDVSPDHLVAELPLPLSGCPDHFSLLHLLCLAVDMYLHGQDIYIKQIDIPGYNK